MSSCCMYMRHSVLPLLGYALGPLIDNNNPVKKNIEKWKGNSGSLPRALRATVAEGGEPC